MPADVLRLSQPRAVTLLAISALLCCSAAVAGLSEGYEALIRKDYATAIKEYRPLAERGNAEAQYRIGRMYEFGQGYRQDKAQGIAWIRKAAAQNHADAQQELGFIYASGDGVRRDDVQAVAWFRKAAEQGNPTAQYNLGLLYAKGQGVKTDYAEAAAWWRKAAAQGNADAQLKLAVVYHTGQGAARDDVLALADATIAARDGDKENVDYRDEIAKPLTPEQRRRAQAWAEAWKIGQPMPGSAATPGSSASPTATAGRPVKTRCSASGTMGGEKFSAANCVASLYGDQHSVAIWFNEDPITPAEAESFQLSSYAEGAKGGKQRTMAIIMLCPGGGKETASAAAIKSIDLNTNHAKSPMAGIQRVVEAPRDFKVEKMTGDVKPGGTLSGRIVGSLEKTAFAFDFDLSLPAKDAAAGMSCQ
ncbi:MAG TPA: tetratricopeptide repeat protein [Casimicrobiaceae bacterium]|nr:tetratricopeptide repeat protein [Casimicrobiaceae bacterium]